MKRVLFAIGIGWSCVLSAGDVDEYRNVIGHDPLAYRSAILSDVTVVGEPDFRVYETPFGNTIRIQEAIDESTNLCVVVRPVPRGLTTNDPARVRTAMCADWVFRLCATNRLAYLNLDKEFLAKDGSLRTEFYEKDGLCLNEKGRQLVDAKVMEAAKWLKNPVGKSPASRFDKSLQNTNEGPLLQLRRNAHRKFIRQWPAYAKRTLDKANRLREKGGALDLLIVGDSISRRWEEEAGLPVYAKLCQGRTVLNMAIGGDRIESQTWLAKSGLIDGLRPRFTMVLLGANNHGYDWSNDGVRNNAGLILDLCQDLERRLPGTKIILIPLLPRFVDKPHVPHSLEEDKKINQILQSTARSRGYIFLTFPYDLWKVTGTIEEKAKKYTTDGVHPSTGVYEKWYAQLRPILDTGCYTPAWNAADRATTLNWFLENVYGVRPKEAEQPKVSFAPIGSDKTMMDGAALRKRVRISYEGPYGKGSFDVTAFIPTAAKKPAPSFLLICNRDVENIDPERIQKMPFWPAEEIVRRGYAAIAFHNGAIAPDSAIGCSEGVFACYDDVKAWRYKNCRPRTAWGTLSAWAWGASRVMDWIVTEPSLDATRVAVVGHSRGGKTALLAGVTDARFGMACSNDSGCSGAKLCRADLPQSETIMEINRSFSYWFCRNYITWCNRDKEIPFDQHQFIALMAPRLVAVGSAAEDACAGPKGEELACQLARPAWDDPSKVDYHCRPGEHDLTLVDWKAYMDFADRSGWTK